MDEVFIVLAALVPVLVIGAVLIELLQRVAPRRGKRPDILGTRPDNGVIVRVTIGEETEFRGSPRSIALRLLLRGWGSLPLYLSSRDADRLLRCWEEEGRIRVRSEWGR